MRSRRRLRLASLAVLSLAALCGGRQALAQPASGPGPVTPGETPERQTELARLRGEIESLRGRIGRLDARASDAAVELERTSLELRLQEVRLQEAVAEHDLAEVAYEQAVERERETAAEVDKVRLEVRRRFMAFDRLGGRGYVRLLLAIDLDTDVLPAIRQLRYLLLTDARALRDFRKAQQELARERAALLEQQREVQQWVDAEAARQVDLEGARARQRAVLARLESERDDVAELAAGLELKEERLGRLLALLGSADRQPLQGAAIEEFEGVLDWPIQGDVVVPFGPRRDPQYGTLVPNHGIEIRIEPGEEVAAVWPGRVLFAAPFQGYGYTAIVRHPERALTLYAGLAELRVSRGDMLDLGDPVGISTERLYFEVRISDEPRDPLQWLR